MRKAAAIKSIERYEDLRRFVNSIDKVENKGEALNILQIERAAHPFADQREMFKEYLSSYSSINRESILSAFRSYAIAEMKALKQQASIEVDTLKARIQGFDPDKHKKNKD